MALWNDTNKIMMTRMIANTHRFQKMAYIKHCVSDNFESFYPFLIYF